MLTSSAQDAYKLEKRMLEQQSHMLRKLMALADALKLLPGMCLEPIEMHLRQAFIVLSD